MKNKSPLIRSAVAYARFSSDNQRSESIDAQLADIRAYAARERYNIIAEYTDEAKSATTDRRPQFQKMIFDAEKGEFSVILVFKLDRFSRDRFDFAYYRRQLSKHGVKVVSINENLSDDPESVILESVLEGMAEYYSRNLSREVMRKGMLPNAKRCQFNGGTPPLGFDIDAEKHYILNESEAEAVKLIFSIYADGGSYDKIINELDKRGYKSKAGGKIGKPTIYDILHNERYKGTYIYNAQASKDSEGRRNRRKMKPDEEIIRIPDGVPRIISDEIWEKAQARLAGAKKTSNGAKRLYILTGKLVCGRCGGAMTGSSQRRVAGGEPYHYYVCATRSNSRKCDKKAVRAELIERLVVEQIYNDILSPEAAEQFADELSLYMTSIRRNLPEQITEWRRRLAETEESIEAIIQAVLSGIHSPALNDRMRDLEAKKEMYTERIAAAEREASVTTATRQQIIAYLASFGDIRQAAPEDQQKAINIFVDRIVVNDDDALLSISTPPVRVEINPSCRHHPYPHSNPFRHVRIILKSSR